MKKTCFRVPTLVLAVAMLLSACGSTTEPSSTSPTGGSTSTSTSSTAPVSNFDPNVNPAGVMPIVKEPVTLTMAIQENAQVTDFVDNEYTAWVQETTGVNLDIITLPSKDTATKVNLMFAAGKDLPDVINMGALENSTLYSYVLDELVIPLDPYIEEYGVEYKKMIEENPSIEAACIAIDGNTYGLPKYNVTEHNQLKFGKMYLYQPWLDELNLEMPTTTDELYDVLKAFQENDPNKNGESDEIPMAGAITGAGTKVYLPTIAPFIPYDDVSKGLLNVDGTITASYMEPEFKDGMIFLNKLVSESLIDPVSFTQDQAQLKALANREEVILGGFVHAYTAVNSSDPRMLDYVMVPLLDSDSEKGGFMRDLLLPKGPSWIVTVDCEYPEVAYRLGDFQLNEEASMRNRYGVEGRDWQYVDSATTDLIGLDGEPARFEIINNVWADTSNTLWRSEVALYNNYDNVYGKGFAADVLNSDKYHHDNSINFYEQDVVTETVPLNALFFTKDELKDYTLLATGIKEHVEQQLAAFATGSRSMDEWEKFQQEMLDLGQEDYLQFIQTAYDRQFANN